MIRKSLFIINEKTANTEKLQFRILIFCITIVVRKDSNASLTPLAGHCEQ